MSTPSIDYAALAAKHGAVPAKVDYSSLAAKHGAVIDLAPKNSPSRPAGLPNGIDLPGLPATAPIAMKEPQGILGTIGTHLGNIVSGPYHAFTDVPRTPEEQQEKGSTPADGTLLNALGQFGLGAARMLVNPTTDALKDAYQLHKQGGSQSSLLAPSTYNAEGENVPTAGSKLIDAIPIVGPWARSYSDEANRSGIIPATAGLLTDAAVPEITGGILGKIRGAAPSMAEGAMGIRRGDRGFGKTPGQAILDETTGVRPETIGVQAQAKIGELMPQLEDAAAARSVRPNNIRGLLPAPAEEIPLHSSPDIEGTPSRSVTLYQPNRSIAKGLPSPSEDIPMSSYSDAFPDQLPSASSSLRAPFSGANTDGLGPGEYLGQIPGERGGLGQTQGVLRKAFTVPEDATPIPTTLPNAIASLGPARSLLDSAMSKATSQNAEGLRGQLGNMNDFLNTRFDTGETIPENVTPSDLLNLKRGFSEEHLRWNPELRNSAVSTGRQAYGALDSELDRTVPEAADINQRISSLIPVKNAAEKLSRADEVPQRLGDKLRAHTGALTSALVGGAAGAHSGGVLGAIGGGALGFALPELLGGPTAKMAIARGMNSPLPPTLIPPLFTGGILAPKKGSQ